MKISIHWTEDYHLFINIEIKLPNIQNILNTNSYIGNTDRDWIDYCWKSGNIERRKEVIQFLKSFPPSKIGISRCVISLVSYYIPSKKRIMSARSVVNGLYATRADFGRILDKKPYVNKNYGVPKDLEKFLVDISKQLITKKLDKFINPVIATAFWYISEGNYK